MVSCSNMGVISFFVISFSVFVIAFVLVHSGVRSGVTELPRWHLKFQSKIYREAKLKYLLHRQGLSAGTPCCSVISENGRDEREISTRKAFQLNHTEPKSSKKCLKNVLWQRYEWTSHNFKPDCKHLNLNSPYMVIELYWQFVTTYHIYFLFTSYFPSRHMHIYIWNMDVYSTCNTWEYFRVGCFTV